MQLKGGLADRSRWSAIGTCPIEKAMHVVGSRNAMVVMREALYGTTRFDDFAERVGMSPATTSSNLKLLTQAGLLERRPYQEAGARTRDEYVLTPAGTDLMPVILGLFDWGSRYASGASEMEFVHADCGEPVDVRVTCEAGHELTQDQIQMRVRRPHRKESGR
jgi:DNA-binding HxlR family transcriptional regulator